MPMKHSGDRGVVRGGKQSIEGSADIDQKPCDVDLRLETALQNHGRGIHEFTPFGATEYLGIDDRRAS